MRFNVFKSLIIISTFFHLTKALKTLPSEFIGKFELDKTKDENFDEYLQARGYNSSMRELIKSVTVTKTFSKSATSGRYNLDTLTSIKNSHHKNWALGEQFQNEVLDSTQHLITFNIISDPKRGKVLTEKHIKVADKSDVETYEYSRQGDYLIMNV
ncbi:unnamed protein product [Dracunculus medinensis]|uniref:FABP domain-containing protein n=1 Tax=Dracunculus medinensis TaxID=318479 RepID=A0A0N4UJC9_DRAME|nr:unnamed protein product [Dracunculus medinensis]